MHLDFKISHSYRQILLMISSKTYSFTFLLPKIEFQGPYDGLSGNHSSFHHLFSCARNDKAAKPLDSLSQPWPWPETAAPHSGMFPGCKDLSGNTKRRLLYYISLLSTVMLHFFFLLIFTCWFLEREERIKIKWDKYRFVAPLLYAFIGWFMYVPWLGMNLQPWCIRTMF